jgi:CRAL/TRIO domain
MKTSSRVLYERVMAKRHSVETSAVGLGSGDSNPSLTSASSSGTESNDAVEMDEFGFSSTNPATTCQSNPLAKTSVTTLVECQRFVNVFDQEAEAKLEAFLQWRQRYHLDNTSVVPPESDWWRNAIEKIFYDPSDPSPPKAVNEPSQFIFYHCDGQPFRDVDGYRVLQILPALIDAKSMAAENKATRTHHTAKGQQCRASPVSAATHVYATMMALYLDNMWRRNEDGDTEEESPKEERISLCIDVRAGHGWPNPPPTALFGLIRHVSSVVSAYYPERLHRCIVYPVPWVAMVVWNVIQHFLGSSIRERVVLVQGCHAGAHADAELPREALERQVPTNAGVTSFWDMAESARRKTFRK